MGASKEAYFQYLNVICYLAPIGFGVVALIGCTPASSFLIVYGLASYFFSLKMVRLILLAAPIASICAGIFLGYFWAWSIGGIFGEARPSLNFLLKEADSTESSPLAIENDLFSDDTATLNDTKKNGKSKKKKAQKKKNMAAKSTNSKSCDPLWVRAVRLAVGVYFVQQSIPKVNDFKAMCHQIAKQISHPTIITKGQNRQTGETVVVDDYREAYFWLRDKTPEDARILSWWDYGYQITGIGNRTTIADGNTWNHEHIALLGRILTGPEKDAHRIARHLADYVLVWAGGGGDDLAKSPHIVRIANSVYRQMCPGDPTCSSFSRGRDGRPSPMMAESLLFKLHSAGMHEGVEVDPNRFKEVFRTKYGRVRIFKILSVSEASKKWVSNNRVCDAPGSWYCRGQYPPALEKVLSEKQDFAQLEDFNKKTDDTEYQKQYFENLQNPDKTNRNRDAAPKKPVDTRKEWKPKKVKKDEIEKISKNWEDTPSTTMLWQMINDDDVTGMMELLLESPE